MKVDILDIDTFIKANDCKQVTSGILIDARQNFNVNGLLSEEIFGLVGTNDRKNLFAYIDLGEYYLHPLVFENLKRLNRNFEKVIAGSGEWVTKQLGFI